MRTLVALVVVAACGSTTTALHAPEPRIVSAGSEPRRILRVTPPLHAVDAFITTVKERITTRTEDTVLETHEGGVDFPSLEISGHSGVLGTGDQATTGEIRIDNVEILDDQVDRLVREAIVEPVAKLKTKRFGWRMTATGQIAINGLPAALGRFADFPSVLPDGAIGVGAEWTVEDAPVVLNVHWQRRTVYRLRDLTANAATIDINAEMRAGSQALSVEPNATTRVTTGTGNASGTVTVRFDHAVAASDMHSTLELNLLIVRGHARVASIVTTENWWTVKPRE